VGVGVVSLPHTADDYGDLAFSLYAGSWLGGAIGARMAGGGTGRAALGSAAGVLLGAYVASTSWTYFAIHAAVAAGVVVAR
jgi:hypothetical protein